MADSLVNAISESLHVSNGTYRPNEDVASVFDLERVQRICAAKLHPATHRTPQLTRKDGEVGFALLVGDVLAGSRCGLVQRACRGLPLRLLVGTVECRAVVRLMQLHRLAAL